MGAVGAQSLSEPGKEIEIVVVVIVVVETVE